MARGDGMEPVEDDVVFGRKVLGLVGTNAVVPGTLLQAAVTSKARTADLLRMSIDNIISFPNDVTSRKDYETNLIETE